VELGSESLDQVHNGAELPRYDPGQLSALSCLTFLRREQFELSRFLAKDGWRQTHQAISVDMSGQILYEQSEAHCILADVSYGTYLGSTS
jgi:hypothetical protein